VKIGKELWT